MNYKKFLIKKYKSIYIDDYNFFKKGRNKDEVDKLVISFIKTECFKRRILKTKNLSCKKYVFTLLEYLN